MRFSTNFISCSVMLLATILVNGVQGNPAPTCKPWCATAGAKYKSTIGRSKKCSWKQCMGCSECATAAPTPAPQCESWCQAHAVTDWATKCAWQNRKCAACAECPTEAPLVAPTDLAPARCVDPDTFVKLTNELKKITGASAIIEKHFPNSSITPVPTPAPTPAVEEVIVIGATLDGLACDLSSSSVSDLDKMFCFQVCSPCSANVTFQLDYYSPMAASDVLLDMPSSCSNGKWSSRQLERGFESTGLFTVNGKAPATANESEALRVGELTCEYE